VCARAAREDVELPPEFGSLADRDNALASPLWAYAYLLAQHGEFERAAPLLAESATVSQARGDSVRRGLILGTAGRLAMLQGDNQTAHALLREAVTLAETLNYQYILGEFQSVLGLATLYSGDLPGAHQLLADSLRLCLELKFEWFLTRVCTYLAELALWEGELDASEQWLAQSLAYPTDRPLGMIDQIERIMMAARLAAGQGAYLRAATLFGLADAMCTRIHYELAGPARQLGDTALEEVRAALDPTDFAEAFAAGKQLSLDDALATILVPTSGEDAPLPLPWLPQ
jgi:hypothetical protein